MTHQEAPALMLHETSDRVLSTEGGPWLVHSMPTVARVVRDAQRGGDRRCGQAACDLDEGVDTDRVLTTVMFTDIVGSTEVAVALGDRAWRRLLARHHALVRAEIRRHRGVEQGTAGDGFLATFDAPARAIRCAARIRDVVRRLALEIRAGVHTGECERVGDEVAGVAVHTGARVMAEAGASEVLVSGTVKDLVAGSGLTFSDRGTHTLKGLPGEWHLFAAA